MKQRALFVAFLMIVAAGCATGGSNDGPPIGVEVEPIGMMSDILYFPGPLNIQFQVTATNPTTLPVTFRSLQLNTVGPGAFYLRSGSVNVNRTVPPGGSAVFVVQTWGRAAGGYMRSETPVTLHGTAYFTSPNNKSFIRMVNEVITNH